MLASTAIARQVDTMGRLRELGPRIATLRPRISQGPKERAQHYGTPEHERWAKAVKDRDGNACADPAHDPARPRHGVKLYADHVCEIRDAPALALDIANGLTRCAHCHGRKTAQERAMRYRQR